MIKKKTVAIFTAYTVPHLGGIERYVDNLVKQFVKMGITPVIITTNFDNSEYVLNNEGVTYYKLPIYSIFKHRYPIIKKNKEYRSIMAKLDGFSFDAIIVNTRFHLTSHIGADYGFKRQIPVYLIEHGSNYVTLDNKFIDFFANRYEDFLTWKIKKKIKEFYGVSKACGEWLKKLGITYSGVWYNSIDCEQCIPEKTKHNGVHYLYAGRIIKQKGVENVLEAFKKMSTDYSDIELVVAGDGPELAKYKQKFNMTNIRFVGKLDYKHLVEQYADADVFLYPPLWPEGLPTSILEAGLFGCCVIGTNQGGIREIVLDGENGMIVRNTEQALEQGMREVYSNQELREKYVNRMKKTIYSTFSWNVTARLVAKDINVLKEDE